MARRSPDEGGEEEEGGALALAFALPLAAAALVTRLAPSSAAAAAVEEERGGVGRLRGATSEDEEACAAGTRLAGPRRDEPLRRLVDAHEDRRRGSDPGEVAPDARVERLAAPRGQQGADAAAGGRELEPGLDRVDRVQRGLDGHARRRARGEVPGDGPPGRDGGLGGLLFGLLLGGEEAAGDGGDRVGRGRRGCFFFFGGWVGGWVGG